MSDIAIFLTGTGTGVGKTVAGCVIAAHWAAEGLDPRVMKPAESDCALMDGSLVPRDALALKTAAGDPRPLDEICPYRYEVPLTPAHAAEREGGPPDLERIVAQVKALKEEENPLLVEGAGGLLAPLTEDALMIDLALRANLPLVLVAQLELGAINHTLLSVREARRQGLQVLGVILSDTTGEATPAAERNPAAVAELCGADAPLLGVIPYLEGVDGIIARAAPGTGDAGRLLRLGQALDLDALG
ncbi:MAG: dethiobiotin synthase [Nitrospinae bacterium]|nr:dethiobiotin synthase [Nitrospinota bacterium]